MQFRKWATTIVEEFTIKGWAMDVERLKSGGSVLTEKYFEEQLQRVREIRLSERKSSSEDHRHLCDRRRLRRDGAIDQTVLRHGTEQASLGDPWPDGGGSHSHPRGCGPAAHGLDHLGGRATGKDPEVRRGVVAKNYLTEDEMAQLSRLVNAYLDVAESMALRKIPMTMQGLGVAPEPLHRGNRPPGAAGCGQTAEIAKAHAESEFEKYRIVQDRLFESDFDRMMKQIEAVNQAGEPKALAADKKRHGGDGKGKP